MNWPILFWCYYLNFHFVFVPIFHVNWYLRPHNESRHYDLSLPSQTHEKLFLRGESEIGICPHILHVSRHLTMFFFRKTLLLLPEATVISQPLDKSLHATFALHASTTIKERYFVPKVSVVPFTFSSLFFQKLAELLFEFKIFSLPIVTSLVFCAGWMVSVISWCHLWKDL